MTTKQILVNGLIYVGTSFGSVRNIGCFLVSFGHEKVECEDTIISFFGHCSSSQSFI